MGTHFLPQESGFPTKIIQLQEHADLVGSLSLHPCLRRSNSTIQTTVS